MNAKKGFFYISILKAKGLEDEILELKKAQLEVVKKQGIIDGYYNIPRSDSDGSFTDVEKKISDLYIRKKTEYELKGDQWKDNEGEIDGMVTKVLHQKKITLPKGETLFDKDLLALKCESLTQKQKLEQEANEEEKRELEQNLENSKIEIDTTAEKLNYHPTERTWRNVGREYVPIFLCSFTELPLNYESLSNLSNGLSIFWCWILAIFISMIIGICAHSTGSAFKEGDDKRVIISVIPIGLIFIVITFLRIEHGEYSVFVLINVAIAIASIGIAYSLTDKMAKDLRYYFSQKGVFNNIKKQLAKLIEANIALEVSFKKELLKIKNDFAKSLDQKKTYSQAYDKEVEVVKTIITLYQMELLQKLDSDKEEVLYTYRITNQNTRSKNGIERVHAWTTT